MEAVLVMGGVNLLLCVWVVSLQYKIRVARAAVEVTTEIIRRLALGEVEVNVDRVNKTITLKEKEA